jgi:hypothetical protein
MQNDRTASLTERYSDFVTVAGPQGEWRQEHDAESCPYSLAAAPNALDDREPERPRQRGSSPTEIRHFDHEGGPDAREHEPDWKIPTWLGPSAMTAR